MRMKSQIRKRYVSVSAYVEYEAIEDFWQPETNSNFLTVVYATHGFATVACVRVIAFNEFDYNGQAHIRAYCEQLFRLQNTLIFPC